MGYTTDFIGSFSVEPRLTREHQEYLEAFANTRRMRRDAEKAAALPDPLRQAVGLPIGPEGAYFVGAGGFKGQEGDDSILDYNEAPGTDAWRHGSEDYATFLERRGKLIAAGAQPGLWCQWVPSSDGHRIEWDGGEKFYDYVDWIKYLIEHFLGPWGYKLNGTVEWQGEERNDMGLIVIEDNAVRVRSGRVVYE